MCGIVGFLGDGLVHDSIREWIDIAMHQLDHRGPEGSDKTEHNGLIAGHTQLSFHAREAARQPYKSSCGRYTVLLNGEIYNYSEIRSELEQGGLTFETRSECELIAALYNKVGAQFVTVLRGMFAIAIYDGQKNALTLARDYIGKKPLYYCRAHHGVAFCSELNPIRALLQRSDIVPSVLERYFLFNAVPADSCLLRDAVKVGPGTIVELTANSARIHMYWRVESQRRHSGFDESSGALELLLREAVRKRLRTDGARLGLMLSGGLDSSLIAVLANEMGSTLPCFSAGFDDPSYDETPYASALARHINAPHYVIRMTDEVLCDIAVKYLTKIDEPIADPSLLAVLAITDQARNHVKGLITGDGADDFFLGYPFFRVVRLLHMAGHVMSRNTAETLAALLRRHPSDANMYLASVLQMLLRGINRHPADVYAHCTAAFTAEELRELLCPEYAARLASTQSAIERSGSQLVRETQFGMVRSFLQSPILCKLDRGAMLNGMETRQPFLDQEVVEFSLRCSVERLMARGRTKVILRDIAQTRLPEPILARKKQGFRLPMRRLIRGALFQLVRDTLTTDRLKRDGIFHPEKVSRLLAAHHSGRQDFSRALWSLACFQLWSSRSSFVHARPQRESAGSLV